MRIVIIREFRSLGEKSENIPVLGRIMAPQDVHVLTEESATECYLLWQKGLCRCD